MIFGCLFSQEGVNKPAGGGVSPLTPQTQAGGNALPEDPERRRDRQDIQRFLGGEAGGFEDLMDRYRTRAYGIALSMTGNHDDAMDAVQKAFIRIHRSLDRFRLDEPFFPWLYRIVRNTALNQRRDERRHRGEIPLEYVKQADGRPDPLEEAVADDLKERLWLGLQAMPAELREVFMLYHFQGLRYREIAAAVDVPIGTVMSRLHAARMRLRGAVGLKEES